MQQKFPALVITCEHASNAVPRFLMNIPKEALESHRGYDIGGTPLSCPIN